MSNIPKIRIAQITRLEKHNTTNNASDVRWGWREVYSEELQYLNENNEWSAVPIEKIYDDSAKRNEEQNRKEKLKKAFDNDLELFKYLSGLPTPKEYWHPTSFDGKFGSFLDYFRAELDYHPAPDGWTYYYSSKGPCAKFKDRVYLVRGDFLMYFLDPDRFLKSLKEIF